MSRFVSSLFGAIALCVAAATPAAAAPAPGAAVQTVQYAPNGDQRPNYQRPGYQRPHYRTQRPNHALRHARRHTRRHQAYRGRGQAPAYAYRRH